MGIQMQHVNTTMIPISGSFFNQSSIKLVTFNFHDPMIGPGFYMLTTALLASLDTSTYQSKKVIHSLERRHKFQVVCKPGEVDFGVICQDFSCEIE
jgi:hypothetical protein